MEGTTGGDSERQPHTATGPQTHPACEEFCREICWEAVGAVAETIAAIVGLVVAIVALMITIDSRDSQNAISKLSELAVQTKRQADATNSQLDQIRRQASATEIIAKSAQQQLDEIRSQTDAISHQTKAIKASSDVSIRSAQAQREMAEVTAKAHKPDVHLSKLTLSGLKSDPPKTFLFRRFRNTGGSAFNNEGSAVWRVAWPQTSREHAARSELRWTGGNSHANFNECFCASRVD
jgi:hypothetical protein